MLDARLAKAIDDLLGLLGRGDTGSDAEALDGESLLAHLLPEGKLEGPASVRRLASRAGAERMHRELTIDAG